MSVAECGDTAGVRSAADTGWDSDDWGVRVWRDGRRRIRSMAWEEESRRDVGAGIYKRNDGSDSTSTKARRG